MPSRISDLILSADVDLSSNVSNNGIRSGSNDLHAEVSHGPRDSSARTDSTSSCLVSTQGSQAQPIAVSTPNPTTVDLTSPANNDVTHSIHRTLLAPILPGSPVPDVTKSPPVKKRKLNSDVEGIPDNATVAAIRAQRTARSRRLGFYSTIPQRSTPSKDTQVEDNAKNEEKKRYLEFPESLETEAILTVAKLSSSPVEMHRLLGKLQGFVRKLQFVLGQSYRIHVLVESAIPGMDINRKYRGCIPIVSSTLLPAIESDVLGSSIVANTMNTTLSVPEVVAKAGNVVRITAFDLVSTPAESSLQLS